MSSPEEMRAFVKEMKQRDTDHHNAMTRLIKTEVHSMITQYLGGHTEECRRMFGRWKILTPRPGYADEIFDTLKEKGVEKSRRRDVIATINASWLRHGCVPSNRDELASQSVAFTSVDISQDPIKNVPIHILVSCYRRGRLTKDGSYPWIVGACAWEPGLDDPLPRITQEQQDATLDDQRAPQTLGEYEAIAKVAADAAPAAAAVAPEPREDEEYTGPVETLGVEDEDEDEDEATAKKKKKRRRVTGEE